MAYLAANVSDWFREEFIDLFTEALKERGPMPKGALIAVVMEQRGLKVHEGNMLMRAHIDELERRGILVLQKDVRVRNKIIVSLAECEEGEVQHSPEGDSNMIRNIDDHKAASLFEDAIAGLALQLNTMAENIAMQNEVLVVLMHETSNMRQKIEMFLASTHVRFTQNDEESSRQHSEILQKLSEIKSACMQAPRDNNMAIVAALGELRQKIHGSNEVVSRLESSRETLYQLLAERGVTSNHTVSE